MNVFAYVSIGYAISTLARRLMKNRCYSKFDDFLLGILGASLGGSLDELFGLTPFGLDATFMMASAVSVLLLFITGIVKESEGNIVRRVRVRTLRRRFVLSLERDRRQARDASLSRNILHKQQVNTQTIRMGEV